MPEQNAQWAPFPLQDLHCAMSSRCAVWMVASASNKCRTLSARSHDSFPHADAESEGTHLLEGCQAATSRSRALWEEQHRGSELQQALALQQAVHHAPSVCPVQLDMPCMKPGWSGTPDPHIAS